MGSMGKMGMWFGSRDNAVIYIAALVFLISIMGCFLLALSDSSSPLRADMAKVLAALALSALGYMFGSSSRRNGRDE
jgi:hypothetical protein